MSYQRLDELQDQLKTFLLDLEKDCLDLPEKVYTKRYVDLSDEQLKAYVQMKQRAIMEIEGTTFSSVNALTQLMRLQQVVAGSLKDDDGQVIHLKNNRLQAVLDILEETDGKVVIFAVFQTDIERLQEEIARKHGIESVATYYGQTPQNERQNIISRFQDPESDLKVFLYQILILVVEVLRLQKQKF